MALWIQNVTPNPSRSDSEPHDYVVRINNFPPLGRFQHVRALGAAACLRAAADAIDAQDALRRDGVTDDDSGL